MTVPEQKLAGKITDREVKRVNYFDTQFLQEADFQDEQAYHIRLRRAHNLAIHGWGIIAGLEIEQTGAIILVKPGIAIDKFGREIILAVDAPAKSYAGFSPGDSVFLTIAYDTATDTSDQNPSGDTTKFIRTIERPKLEKSLTFIDDGTAIVLGKVTFNAAGTIDIDDGKTAPSSRQIARSQSSPIVGIATDGTIIKAPDGNPANWVIFVSLHQIGAPSKSIAELEISAQATGDGWAIKCSGTDSADAILAGDANYMILRKLNN